MFSGLPAQNVIPIIALGIPLALFYFNKKVTYSLEGQDALKFAREELEKRPNVSNYKFSTIMVQLHEPTDANIAKLTTIFYLFQENLFKEIKRHGKGAWRDEEVLKFADNCINIAYAVAVFALKELGPLAKKFSYRSNEIALTNQESYQYKTFFFCTNVYHGMRSAMTWKEIGFCPSNPIPEGYAELFYQKGTMQNRWNNLYNDYCRLVRKYVDEDKLTQADPRFEIWVREDTGIPTFRADPGEQPT